jgi:hypothetical protein
VNRLLEAFVRLCVVTFHGFLLWEDELRARLLKKPTANGVFAIPTVGPEFKLPARPASFPVANGTQHVQ